MVVSMQGFSKLIINSLIPAFSHKQVAFNDVRSRVAVTVCNQRNGDLAAKALFFYDLGIALGEHGRCFTDGLEYACGLITVG